MTVRPRIAVGGGRIAMRERIEIADVPASFRGAPIALVTAGLMALAFMGFSGMTH